METKEFVVNVVPNALAQPMVQTSAPYTAEVNEFEAAKIESIASELVAPPRVQGSPVHFECRLHSIQEIKDDRDRITSRIIIGRILRMHIAQSVLTDDGTIDLTNLKPLARLGGQSYGKISEPFAISRPSLDKK